MDLRCPNCNSSDLKKASLAYEEGLTRGTSKSRFRALLFGEDGPNVVVGTAVMKGMYQTELSRALRPPKKRSYGKLLLWAGVVSVVSLIFYSHTVMSSASLVSALSVVMFGVMGTVVFLSLLFMIWRHNHLVYPRRYEKWERAFLCKRCGGVSYQPSEMSR